MRGLLLDRGIAIAVSARRAQRLIPKILAAPDDELTALMRGIVSSLYAFMLQIDERIRALDRKIDAIFKASEVCQRIAKIRGIGPKTATAMIAAIGDGSDFKNGRQLAAWLGLVPRQHSSGDRRVMMGISKRGSFTFMAHELSPARQSEKPTRKVCGSTSFASGAVITARRSRSLTRTHGKSGPC